MTISEIVNVAPQAVDVFKRQGIGYRDNKTQFEEACEEAQVLPEIVKEELKRITIPSSIYIRKCRGGASPIWLSI